MPDSLAVQTVSSDAASDPVWTALRAEAEAVVQREPILSGLLQVSLLNRNSFEEALSYRLPRKLGHHAVSEQYLHDLFMQTFADDPGLGRCIRRDLQAVRDRDPAAGNFLNPFLYFKGFQALATYRVAHHLCGQGRSDMALYLQSIMSEVFQVDIHPAARIGCGVLFDHATSIVIGETAVIEDNVSILHEVTLGGTGKDKGDRHPKVREGVLIGAGAKILGNVEIGHCAKIGAGSVVLDDVRAHTTVAGVPAKEVGESDDLPALGMDHHLRCGDY